MLQTGLAHVAIMILPGDTGRRHARFAEVLTQSDERNESGQWSQARSIAIEHDFREGVFSGVAYPEFLASGIPCKKCSVCLDS
jgi:hypothetical protein